ncbi:MAG: PQQ-binding-like beta-propeller repeat protein [Phycisphaeraceae bacterium]|nr:MAG: PQQ-binding-like beta-propeller repeat protein [Phycisphaeraceae bacterium]
MTEIENLVFVAAKRWVSAVDGGTGDVLWTTEVPGSGWFNSGFMTLVADPTGVYATRTGRLTCLDPISGQILWSIKVPGGGNSLPIVATMMGSGGSNAAIVAAMQAQQQAAAAAAASG